MFEDLDKLFMNVMIKFLTWELTQYWEQAVAISQASVTVRPSSQCFAHCPPTEACLSQEDASSPFPESLATSSQRYGSDSPSHVH